MALEALDTWWPTLQVVSKVFLHQMNDQGLCARSTGEKIPMALFGLQWAHVQVHKEKQVHYAWLHLYDWFLFVYFIENKRGRCSAVWTL